MAIGPPAVKPKDPTLIEFDVRTDEMLVNMGPQHPSTHGVLRLLLATDGEVIRDVTPHLGYLHRCAEKIGENVTPIQFIPYTDRMDYLAALNMNLGYSLAVEKLCGLKVPEKANVIRVIIAELNRIASHLVGMGTYGLDLGTFSPFLYAFREREMILDLFEATCGARLTYSYLTIGGPHDDFPAGWTTQCRAFLEYFKKRIPEYHALTTTNHIFIARTANIGVLPKRVAISHACSGPVLRGSLDRRAGDPEWDLRKLEPYCGYETYQFQVAQPPFDDDHFGIPYRTPREAVLGDCWHRFLVRMIEVVQSVAIIEQALSRYDKLQNEFLAERERHQAEQAKRTPEERKKADAAYNEVLKTRLSHRVEPPRHLPAGEAYLETECPRGAMGFHIVGRADKPVVPLRVRAKSSSFLNLSVIRELCRGCLIADVPAVIGSLDIVMGEIDR
jgi:NADH-quinone oxidoreductase subunit D